MQYKIGIAVVIVFALLTSGLMTKAENEEKVLFAWERNGNEITFTAFCEGSNYTWQFGDGEYGYGKMVNHSYSSEGSYDVKLIVDGNEVDARTIDTADGSPKANFYWLPTTPYSYEEVMFIDNSTDSDGYIVNWSWDIESDGTIDGYGKYIKHVFTTPGKHDVTLRVVDDDGMMDSITKQINVLNILPVPKFYWTKVNDSILFNASWSYDKDGYIVNYTWQFGDGSTGYGKVISHEYAANKNYTVTLYVTDDYGETNSTSMSVDVSNKLPKTGFYWQPSQPTDLDTVYFYSTSNDTDGNITLWQWNFGDGSTGYGRNVSHKYESNGVYTVTLFVLDNDMAYNTTSKQITILNVPPVADFIYKPVFPLPNRTIWFNSTSYDRDGVIVNYTWNFGDNTTAYGRNVSHVYPQHGIYNVTLTVTDDDNDSSTKKIELVIADFYVNKSVYDPTNHTWKKIQDAVDNASDGSFIYVMSGEYNESVLINKSVYMLGKNAIINGENYSVYLKKDAIFIENFDIINAETGAILASNYSIIQNCVFYDSNISLNISGNYNEIKNNIIEGNASLIIYGNNNEIKNNEIEGKEEGIAIHGQMNEIYSNNITAITGIETFSLNSINGNNIYGCDYGVKIYHENSVLNNSIYNCSYGIYGTVFSIEQNKLWNNERAIHAINVTAENCNLTDNGIAVEGGESHLINTSIYNGSIDVGEFYFYNGSIKEGSINCIYGELVNSRIEDEKEINGNIYASNTVFKRNKRISANGVFWQCNFTENGVFELNNSYIKNCSFYKNGYGTYLGEGNIVENSTFKANNYAIFIEGNSNEIENNSLLHNQHALYLNSTKNNSIFNNTINLNENGVEVLFSLKNSFLGNVFSNNTYAIDIEGDRISHFYNYFENNTVNGYPSIYEINGSNFVINKSYGFIGLVGCRNVTILNQNIGNNGKSIIVVNSINSSIIGNSIHNNRYGIYIFESKNIVVENSSIFLNDKGILLKSSRFNSIMNCNIFNNDIGINIFNIQKTYGGNYIDSKFEGNGIGILIQTMEGSEIHGKVDSIKIDGSFSNEISGNVSKLI